MYYVYVLQSQKNKKKYYGFTNKGVIDRLAEHNAGANSFTRQNGPFEIIYFEEYQDASFARKRERFFKTGHGRAFLKRRLEQERKIDL